MNRTEAPTIHIATSDPERLVTHLRALGFMPWWLSRVDGVLVDATFGVTVEGHLPLLIAVSRKVAPAVFQLADALVAEPACWRGDDAELLELARRIPRLVLEAAAANPHGFEVVAHALAGGQVKHPGRGLGPSADQKVRDHIAALERHAADMYWESLDGQQRELMIDADTNLPHAGLASARGILAIQRADLDARAAEMPGSGER